MLLEPTPVLLDVGSTAGPGIIVRYARGICNSHFRLTTGRGSRSRVGSDSVRRSDPAGGVVGGGSAVRSKTASNGVGALVGAIGSRI
jgi:hypothetical protein